MKKNIFLSVFLLVVLTGYGAAAEQQFGVKVAVLPFEVFSMDKEPVLGQDISAKLSKQLSINPSIVTAGGGQIGSVMRPDEFASLTEARLQQLARLLNANCVVFGSITKIRDELSIDVQLYSAAEAGAYYKTFAEGSDADALIAELAARIEQELMEKAELIPSAQRPRVSVKPQVALQPAGEGFDVNREIALAFGTEKAADDKPAPEEDETDGRGIDEEDLAEAPLQRDEGGRVDAGKPERPPVDKTAADEEPSSEPAEELADASAEPASPEAAAADKPETKKKKKPGAKFFSFNKAININSDSMEYDNRKNMAIFKGSVVARQSDIVIFADSMYVYYSDSGGLNKVLANGNVKIIQGERIATGEKIIFNNATQTIVATGSPRIWQGDNVVHGTKITLFLKEDRSVVEGGPNSRASATIYPGSDRKKKK